MTNITQPGTIRRIGGSLYLLLSPEAREHAGLEEDEDAKKTVVEHGVGKHGKFLAVYPK